MIAGAIGDAEAINDIDNPPSVVRVQCTCQDNLPH